MLLRYVLYHKEMGVYLGSCMGFGFWSNIDSVNQPSAVTFESAKEADEVKLDWDTPVPDASAIQVEADEGIYASRVAVAKAGLPTWSIDTDPKSCQ